MKLSRSLLVLLMAFVFALPFSVSIAQAQEQDNVPHESVADFVLLNGYSAVIPADMGLAARVRYRTFGAGTEGSANIYAALFGAVQMDVGYGERNTVHHLTGGVKVPVLYLSNSVLAARYEFNSFAYSEPTLNENLSTHTLSGLFTGRHDRFGLSLELGYLISADSRMQGDLFRIATQYAANNRLTYLMEFQRYQRIDRNYPDAMTFGLRMQQLEWLTWEAGMGFYDVKFQRQIGLWASLIFHPFEAE